MKQAKLQLALDLTDLNTAMQIADDLQEWWDILEVGTVLLLNEGLKSVEKMRHAFPEADILADTKIIDSGRLLADSACKAGANIISVVSAASAATITESKLAANAQGCKVVLDHLSADWRSGDFIGKIKLGVDLIGLHMPKDLQNGSVIDRKAAQLIAHEVQVGLSIAGGMTPEIISGLNEFPINVFVVGGYVINAEDKREKIKQIKKAINKKEN